MIINEGEEDDSWYTWSKSERVLVSVFEFNLELSLMGVLPH